jgi:putative CocE/NonD family hydrolase
MGSGRGRVWVVAAVGLLASLSLWAGSASAATTTVVKQGYIATDGVKLAYTVDLPAGTGRFPVALAYAGYCEGSDAKCNDATNATALLAAGYAVLGVNIRGTGCSTGTFDAFTAPEWRDGAAAVEWASRQPWSTGHVGMFGDSFPGITQLGVAGLRPRHLDAIAPFQVTTDLYRDVAYPGGITNTGFGAFWGGVDQPDASYTGGLERGAEAGDAACLQDQLVKVAAEPVHNIALNGLLHPFDDAFWQEREPGAKAARINVPVFGCATWQDDEVSSRSVSYLGELRAARTWFVGANGYHAMCEIAAPRITSELVRFFDHFVKGESNGFRRTPHLQLWHDAVVSKAGDDVPTWVTTARSYRKLRVRPLSLYFRSAGALSLTAPTGAQAPQQYAYPGPAAGTEDGIVFGQDNLLWKAGEPPAASVAYTTPPLSRDTEFFGSGSANLWVSSTASDTDLQITVTEVRPDGQEVFVGRGWLRASARALDPKRSTTLAPYQTDRQADARPLVAGQATQMRAQLWPFDYVFRKGSSLRVWIDAPTGETGGWSFNFTKTPAVNSVYADGRHPSAMVLGHLPGGRAKAPLPACDTLINQPCRPNQAAVPAGTMAIPRPR